MRAIGIDIGTTTVCGIVMDTDSGIVLDVQTLHNTASCEGKPWERIQDPDRITDLVKHLYREFLSKYSDIVCIGLTGQMHGILFTDESGRAVSPLYTWQDESGNETADDGRRYAEHLTEKTGHPMATGFGLTTYYYLAMKRRLPESAAKLCTIPDYVGMQLTGQQKPVITPSMGASLGCFDLQKLEFDTEMISLAGLDPELLPECRDGYAVLGTTPEGIPVAAAIGDNQASVIGSVRNPDESVLVNVGTGSQVSVVIEHYMSAEHVELRPLVCGRYLLAGSGLCGGRAYAALENFFSMVVEAAGGVRTGKLYGMMSELLRSRGERSEMKPLLIADTRFCGTREDPQLTGSFTNLTLENFDPASMTEAVLRGIAEELLTFHQHMIRQGAAKPKYLIGSGNGIRMNPWLRRIFEETCGLPMQLPLHHEEAAFGAALYSLCASGVKEDLAEVSKVIRYEDNSMDLAYGVEK